MGTENIHEDLKRKAINRIDFCVYSDWCNIDFLRGLRDPVEREASEHRKLW